MEQIYNMIDEHKNEFNYKLYRHFIQIIKILTDEIKHRFNNKDLDNNDILYICSEYYNMLDRNLFRYSELKNKQLTKIETENTYRTYTIKNENNIDDTEYCKKNLNKYFDDINKLLTIYTDDKYFNRIDKKEFQIICADFNNIFHNFINKFGYDELTFKNKKCIANLHHEIFINIKKDNEFI